MISPLTLDAWLAELERRHPRAIELGLDRVERVWRALAAPAPAKRVITVGGTNGKGSTVAFIEAAAGALGWRVGTYTSPHLFRYNERIRLFGADADDTAIVAAFERIEAARGDTPLTYFEFGTLAALLLMAEASLELAVLEVGLGGRLDAVNIIDADVSVVTTVALDHQDWLGETRAQIGREKAGIARAGRPFVVGERNAEPALLAAAEAAGARVFQLGRDFDGLPATAPKRLPLAAPCQEDNAATALAALVALDADVDMAKAATGLASARLAGRLQTLRVRPDIVVDVGHNPQAASVLADWLGAHPAATDAVFSALADKDIEGITGALAPHIRRWHLAGLETVTSRGLNATALAQRLAGIIASDSIVQHPTVVDALQAARAALRPDERLLVFGSFYTVAEAGQALAEGL